MKGGARDRVGRNHNEIGRGAYRFISIGFHIRFEPMSKTQILLFLAELDGNIQSVTVDTS